MAVIVVSVVPGGEIILKVHLRVSMLIATLSQESVGKVALFGVLMCDYLFCLRQFREGLSVYLLRYIIQEYLVLLVHANCFSDVHFRIEPLVPLWVGKIVLPEC